MPPTTEYAQSGQASIAYQQIGDGEIDLLIVGGWQTQLQLGLDVPSSRRFIERLAEFSRLILYDRRGSGLSDDVDDSHTLEDDVQDALAVLDWSGSERAAVYAKWTGGFPAVLLAADHPERVSALVMYASLARASWAPDYDWAMTPEQRAAAFDDDASQWGRSRERGLARWAPSMADDPALKDWFSRMERSIASPGRARAIGRELASLDVRAALPRIQAPTLVLHRPDELVWDLRHSRYLAEHIPGARYVALEGRDSLDFVGNSEAIAEEVEEFLTGVRGAGEHARVLLTVMFTDIVDSTARAAELGDTRWRDLLAEHDKLVRRELSRFGGREVKTMGDGFLATFSGSPSSALRCAQALSDAARELGMEVRIGVHTGECEVIGDDVGGMAVHIASRVNGLAGAGEVLVSTAVAGAVAGGPYEFEDRGAHELKGVPGSWQVFALAMSP